jgi:hypothetical protein
MTEQHRATLETWINIRAKASLAEVEPPSDWDYCQGLTELRDRVMTMDACLREIYEQLDRLKTGHESNWARIVNLEEGPAVDESRGPVATDDELCDLYDKTYDTRPNSLRAVYNLGRQHAAAAQLTSQNPQ